ncbi:hypothetical protein ACGG0V_004576 [Salmonella enterica]|nr:hypothetical protein [Salmonella enterica]EKT1605330.1 hypothetical protein [Salmonella enterica]
MSRAFIWFDNDISYVQISSRLAQPQHGGKTQYRLGFAERGRRGSWHRDGVVTMEAWLLHHFWLKLTLLLAAFWLLAGTLVWFALH